MSRRQARAEIDIIDRIMHRRQAGKRQPSWHEWMNVAITPLRRQIENLFGSMKRRYLYRRVRYRGLVRNRCQLWLLCMTMNLRRAAQITSLSPSRDQDRLTWLRPTQEPDSRHVRRYPLIRHVVLPRLHGRASAAVSQAHVSYGLNRSGRDMFKPLSLK